MDITVKANELKQNNGATIGIANINFGDKLKVRNVTIKNSEKGRFVGMPSYQTSKVTEEGKPIYQEVFNPITKEGRQKLIDAIFDSFDSGKEIRIKDASDKITAQVHVLEDNGNGTIGIGKLYLGDDFVVNNITVKLTNDKSDKFVSFPSYKSNEVDENGKAVYKNFVYPANAEARGELNEMVLKSYESDRELKESQAKEEHAEVEPEKDKENEKPKKGVKAKLKDGEKKKAEASKDKVKDIPKKKDLEAAI